MPLDPKSGSFYKYLSGNECKVRNLFYHVLGVSLTLTDFGDPGKKNRSILVEDIWDKKFICCSLSLDFVPGLASLFSGYLQIIGPFDYNDSSSFEGD